MPEAEAGSSCERPTTCQLRVHSIAAIAPVVPSFCSIGTILPSRPARGPCRRAQRRSRMARLRATASAARSVLDGCEHDGMLSRVGSRLPKLTNRTIKKRETKHIKKQDHAQMTSDFILFSYQHSFWNFYEIRTNSRSLAS